jgi:hypothetical protein
VRTNNVDLFADTEEALHLLDISETGLFSRWNLLHAVIGSSIEQRGLTPNKQTNTQLYEIKIVPDMLWICWAFVAISVEDEINEIKE